jgi:hypothetical protein
LYIANTENIEVGYVWRLFAAFEVGNANQLICEPRKKKKQVSIENFNCV